MKRYINVATIAKDVLLVARLTTPLALPTDLIVVPHYVVDGLATALHIKLDHPSKHQLQLVMKLPEPLKVQTTEGPPAVVGTSFAADVLKRNKQAILVLRETSTSYTVKSIVPDEKAKSLRETLARLCLDLRPISGPAVTVSRPSPWLCCPKGRPHPPTAWHSSRNWAHKKH